MSRADIAVFGSGAWGTALAMAWGRQGARVALWGHPPEAVKELAHTRRHPRLPHAELPEVVKPVVEPDEALAAPLWISALPTQISAEVWSRLAASTSQRPQRMLHVSKGLLLNTHQRLSQALEPLLGLPVGVLSGPSFADEVARELPAAIVLALPGGVDDASAQALQAQLATPRLRLYLSRDVTGVELCGSLKNTLAIAAGCLESLGLGNNARAALLTRGLAEMARLVEKLGGRPETVTGLAGMGDLLLTATGPQSRNRRFGELVGRGVSPQEATASMGEQVVEGVASTQAALALAAEVGLELPITQEVARLIQGADPREALDRLMQRSLKSEN
ncbi:MAG: NAD(P)-dependent glycerol-3-phosphate dehydrogenase [Firmicutes bacterium]|nr:NAD(P)-dependent glycerol-3-phosphate dehydrogenase [Bacillota bacterium]